MMFRFVVRRRCRIINRMMMCRTSSSSLLSTFRIIVIAAVMPFAAAKVDAVVASTSAGTVSGNIVATARSDKKGAAAVIGSDR